MTKEKQHAIAAHVYYTHSECSLVDPRTAGRCITLPRVLVWKDSAADIGRETGKNTGKNTRKNSVALYSGFPH